MRPEIEYKMWVEQPVALVMEQVEKDAAAFHVTPEELNRAVFNWLMNRINTGPVPQWLLNDIQKLKD